MNPLEQRKRFRVILGLRPEPKGKATTRYWVKVLPVKGRPEPSHPYMNNVNPDLVGRYNFPFITRRPRYPAPPIVGKCRYVEDFEDVYGSKNVEVREMGPLNEDWLASIERAKLSGENMENGL